MTTLFLSDTDSGSQRNGLMCVHGRCATSECPSNKHYLHDISHASSMWGERNRRTATRERTNKSSTFPASRVTIRAKPARDAALSLCCTLQRSLNGLADACRSSAHVYTSQMHISVSNNGTLSANASPRVETCCCHQLTRSKYSWPFHNRPKIHRPAHFGLAVLHLQEDTSVAHRTR